MSLTAYELKLLKEKVRSAENMTKTEAHEVLIRMGMFDEKGNVLEPYRRKKEIKTEKPSPK